MKHIGHPIFSDSRYGGNKILKGTIFNKYKQFVTNCFDRSCLGKLYMLNHLGFIHPISGKGIKF